MAMVESSMTTAVVTFTPPAVEPELPPMNIRTMVRNLLDSFIAAVSTLLKPAVRGVTCLLYTSSLEITSLVKEMGGKHVVSKATRDIQAKFLLRNGADEVIYPEKDIAERCAAKYSICLLYTSLWNRISVP